LLGKLRAADHQGFHVCVLRCNPTARTTPFLLRDVGKKCGVNRVYRLMRDEGLKAQVGYREPRHRSGDSHIVVPNRLQRQFNPESPDESWVIDITHIRTHEGWLCLAVVVDLFSRKVIGWSMQSRITKEIVLVPCSWLYGDETLRKW